MASMLKTTEVRRILDLYAKGLSLRRIAQMVRRAQSTVGLVVKQYGERP